MKFEGGGGYGRSMSQLGAQELTDKGALEVQLGTLKTALASMRGVAEKLNEIQRTAEVRDRVAIDNMRNSLYEAFPKVAQVRIQFLDLIDQLEDRPV